MANGGRAFDYACTKGIINESETNGQVVLAITTQAQQTTRKIAKMDFLKVSSKSSPSSVAGAISGMIKDGVPVEIQSVGAGAVNQAVKAIAISRGFLSPVGIEIVCIPSFADITIDGESRTAIRFSVIPRMANHTQDTIPPFNDVPGQTVQRTPAEV